MGVGMGVNVSAGVQCTHVCYRSIEVDRSYC